MFRSCALKTSVLLFFLLWVQCVVGQDSQRIRVSPYLMTQTWLVYSHGQEIFDQGEYLVQPAQWGILLRRGRAGMKATIGERLFANLMLAFDQVGNTPALAPKGGTFSQISDVQLLELQIRYRLVPETEWLFLTSGYFRPQLDRESITSAWAVNSLEKAMSQSYVRRHLVNASHGRAPGVNLGGLIATSRRISLEYNSGLFLPVSYSVARIDPPTSLLWVSRMVVAVGDPEHETYSLGYDISYFGKRKGMSIGGSVALQGESAVFTRSRAIGIDLLANYGSWNLDGSWTFMSRLGWEDTPGEAFSHHTQAGHFRFGYLIPMRNDQWLELSTMLMHATGPAEESHIEAVQSFGGRETTFDTGINWYLDEKSLKIALHYVYHRGDLMGAEPGAQLNDYFIQQGLGAIRRGNYLGLGLSAIIR